MSMCTLYNVFAFQSAFCCFKAFAKVGMDYAQLCNEPTLLEKCQEIATNATWGIKLGRLKVNNGWSLSPERNCASGI